MTMRIAILAACAGTLDLAQADRARASYGTASGSESPAKLTEVGAEPVVVLAQNIQNVSGNNTWSGGNSRSRAALKAASVARIERSEIRRPFNRTPIPYERLLQKTTKDGVEPKSLAELAR